MTKMYWNYTNGTFTRSGTEYALQIWKNDKWKTISIFSRLKAAQMWFEDSDLAKAKTRARIIPAPDQEWEIKYMDDKPRV